MELDDKTREAFKTALNSSPMYRHMQMEVQDIGEGRSRITLSISSLIVLTVKASS